MNGLPEFWRTEIWHPLTVHLPLAVLILATLFKMAGIFLKKNLWRDAGAVLLIIGTIGAWIAVYTGNLADGVVSREICDPTVIEDHENGANIVAWLFTAATLLILIDYTGYIKSSFGWLQIIILLIMLTGSGFLAYTGHLGATLVYQQAAGVYTPSEDCSEFDQQESAESSQFDNENNRTVSDGYVH